MRIVLAAWFIDYFSFLGALQGLRGFICFGLGLLGFLLSFFTKTVFVFWS